MRPIIVLAMKVIRWKGEWVVLGRNQAMRMILSKGEASRG